MICELSQHVARRVFSMCCWLRSTSPSSTPCHAVVVQTQPPTHKELRYMQADGSSARPLCQTTTALVACKHS